MTTAYEYQATSDDDIDAITPYTIRHQCQTVDIDISKLTDATNTLTLDATDYLFDNSTRAQFAIYADSDNEKLYFVPRHDIEATKKDVADGTQAQLEKDAELAMRVDAFALYVRFAHEYILARVDGYKEDGFDIDGYEENTTVFRVALDNALDEFHEYASQDFVCDYISHYDALVIYAHEDQFANALSLALVGDGDASLS